MISTEATPDRAPTETASLKEIESGAVFEPDTWHMEPETQSCAIVTATKALNLRAEPNEKASIITELLNGNIVIVIGRVGEWWKVQTDDYTGYAKADYLKESECE
jgi:uncharacterized protein YgiM (DUF1202 family)